ncbi:wings apart-like protein homolog [Kryptolebias marmoratus]|uniref:Wings apart-like protein homolog n=1 Tax=Kryptolebias marmoratus TaxID=37003 RepID=A0A3Q2ZDM9_KRYMA|nr:wings apart-like protein homolog [Kryptolebias marmoratus]XP_037836780.1 wings apart-like protein homolog [Kryptolebias marmoratus]
MTSRFGKTYSRKGGEGTSKFDEVLSTKRGTLSTKWGDTTYKAKVGSKRAGAPKDDSVLEVYKRPRPSGDSPDDPFGFDSDEESKPVSSRAGSKLSPAKPASAEPPQAERPGLLLDAGSRSSFLGGSHSLTAAPGTSWPAADRTEPRIVEDTVRFFNSSSAGTGKSRQSSSAENQHSYLWYQNASDSDKKPLAQTTTLKTGSKAEPTYDSWDVIMGLRPPSPTQEPRRPAPTLAWSSLGFAAGGLDPVQTRHEKAPSPPRLHSSRDDVSLMMESDFIETSSFSQTSTSLSHERNSNCRTYRRPNKQGSGRTSDSNSFASIAFGADVSKSTTDANNTKTSGIGGSRVRTRDYTVLHPSSMSMCNVTIQGRAVEEFGSDAAPTSGEGGTASGSTTQLGDLGWQRKKTEAQNTRFRQTQPKSKRDGEDYMFGFDDTNFHQEEDSSDGRSTHKIQYFGFDDRSDSDGAEDDCGYKERRKGQKAAASKVTFSGTAEETPADDTLDPFDRLQSRDWLQSRERPAAKERKKNYERPDSKRRADVLDFSEEGLKVLASGPRRQPQSKPAEKNPDTFRRIFSAHKKSPTKAVYNARHWTVESEEEPPPPFFSRSHTAPAPVSAGGSSKEPTDSQKDDGVFKAPPPPPKVTKCVTIPTDPCQDTVTALKCHKEHKELYTVVQHVKHFNDVVEFGENQEFTDDFEYLATGLKTGQPLNTRCLSVISLATRCAMPSFRMHLRARGKVAQVFKTLNDAPQHPNLALCTASLMYILSRDRLNMDLDRSCLDLMIRLLELDQDQGGGAVIDSSLQFSARELAKIKEKIRKLCDTVHNKHLDLQNITTGHLAMETLLSLTSKRAGDWFKEELRLLGGLDHIVDKVKECVDNLNQEDEKEKLVSSLWGAERCLRVLESVTVHNPENQSYLIAYKDSSLIISSAKALRRCEEMIQRYSGEQNSDGAVVGKAVENCMRAIIGVLLNLTHDNEWGSTKTGEQEDLIVTALNCVLKAPQYLPQEQRFDIRVLGLGLLINLVEYSARNRYCLMEMEMEGGQGPCDSTVLLSPQHGGGGSGPLSAIAALVQLFLQRERAAVLAEAQTDDLIKETPKAAQDQSGQWQETGGEIQWVANDETEKQDEGKKKEDEEDEQLDLNKALQHAGKHMEDSIVASYTALLLGCLCQGSPMNVTTVRENLPKGDFSIMTEMLKKFLNFMNLTCDVGTTGQKSISRIIDYLEHC